MSHTTRSLMQCAAAALSLTFLATAPAAAQQQAPAPASAEPEFFPRYNFHLTAAALEIADQRFSWDTHFGGELDLLDYVAGRSSIIVDYEAVASIGPSGSTVAPVTSKAIACRPSE